MKIDKIRDQPPACLPDNIASNLKGAFLQSARNSRTLITKLRTQIFGKLNGNLRASEVKRKFLSQSIFTWYSIAHKYNTGDRGGGGHEAEHISMKSEIGNSLTNFTVQNLAPHKNFTR